MLWGGTICGLGLVVLDTMLLKHYKDVLATNPELSYWLKQGFNSISIGIDILFTAGIMWVGSSFSKRSESSQKNVDEFFERMSIPTKPVEKSYDKSQSPFSVVGVSLILMGIALLIVGFISKYGYADQRSFTMNLLTAGVFLLIGIVLWLKTRQK